MMVLNGKYRKAKALTFAKNANVKEFREYMKKHPHHANIHLNGLSMLHVACKRGNLELVESLLSCHANVNYVDSKGETPIFAAISSGEMDLFKRLVAAGAKVNVTNHEGRTLVHCAALSNTCAFLTDKSAKGMEVDCADNNGKTPLNLAVRSGNTEFALLLLSQGANPYITDIDCNSPKSLAERLDNESILLEIQMHAKAAQIRSMHSKRKEYLDTINPAKFAFDDDLDYNKVPEKNIGGEEEECVPYTHISLAHSHSASHSMKLQLHKEINAHYATGNEKHGHGPELSHHGTADLSKRTNDSLAYSMALSKRRILGTMQASEELILRKNYMRSAIADPNYKELISATKIDDIFNATLKHLGQDVSVCGSEAAEIENVSQVSGKDSPRAGYSSQPTTFKSRKNVAKSAVSDENESVSNYVVIDQSKLSAMFSENNSKKKAVSATAGMKRIQFVEPKTHNVTSNPKIESTHKSINSHPHSQHSCSSILSSVLNIDDDEHFHTPSQHNSCNSFIISTAESLFGANDANTQTKSPDNGDVPVNAHKTKIKYYGSGGKPNRLFALDIEEEEISNSGNANDAVNCRIM